MTFFSFKRNTLTFLLGVLSSLLLIFITASAEQIKKFKEISIGNNDAPIEIIVYSSLTCPHCATFHLKIFPEIKKKYIDTGKVKMIHRDFPLDLAALNASKLLHCIEKNKQMNLLDEIYKKQDKWLVGNTIEEINKNLVRYFGEFGFDENNINKCFQNTSIEDNILNSRINGNNKYNIKSTPTIIINDKMLDVPVSFENIEKKIENII